MFLPWAARRLSPPPGDNTETDHHDEEM